MDGHSKRSEITVRLNTDSTQSRGDSTSGSEACTVEITYGGGNGDMKITCRGERSTAPSHLYQLQFRFQHPLAGRASGSDSEGVVEMKLETRPFALLTNNR